MVGEPVLRKVVGPDPLRPVARAHLALARIGALRRRLLTLRIEDAALENLHRPIAVLELRTLILTGHHGPGRKVGDAYRGVGPIDVLTTGTRGAVGVDLEVIRIDVHLHIFGLGQDRNGGRRGVDAPLRLCGGNALHPVHAALPLEPRVDRVACDGRRHLFEATHGALAHRGNLKLPAAQRRIPLVHLEQVPREDGRLVATRTGPDLDDDILGIQRVRRQHRQLQRMLCLGNRSLRLFEVHLRQFAQLRIAFAQQLATLLAAAVQRHPAAVALHHRTHRGQLPVELREGRMVACNRRVTHPLFELNIPSFNARKPSKHRSSSKPTRKAATPVPPTAPAAPLEGSLPYQVQGRPRKFAAHLPASKTRERRRISPRRSASIDPTVQVSGLPARTSSTATDRLPSGNPPRSQLHQPRL